MSVFLEKWSSKKIQNYFTKPHSTFYPFLGNLAVSGVCPDADIIIEYVSIRPQRKSKIQKYFISSFQFHNKVTIANFELVSISKT